MNNRRFIQALTAPLVLVVLAGCSPTAPTDTEPPKFTASLHEVRDSSQNAADKMISQFPGSAVVATADPDVSACAGEDPGVGRWVWATTFSSTDLAGTVAQIKQEYGDSVTSTGTTREDVEYSDGTTWPATNAHILIEDETGSYLVMYGAGAEGTALVRVISACGVLR